MSTYMKPTSRQDCLHLDAQDALAPLRHQFSLPEGVIYLDGNSLGVLPKTAAARAAQVVTQDPQLEHRRLDGTAAAHRQQNCALGGRGRR
jgi:kynureninase